jgi:gas vesicle protein
MTTSAELQREAEVTRAGLSSTLDELRLSMTRTAITSGATALAKESGATLARAVVRRASDNPLAALLFGAGIMMLFSRGNGQSLTGGLVERATRAIKGSAHDAGDVTTASVHDASEQVGHTVRDATGQVKQAVQETAGRVEQRVRERTGQVQQKVGEVQEKARRLTTETVNRTTDRLTQFAQAQPILVTALAVAAGAAVGAALPVTETERRYLGPAAARATAKGRDVVEHVADAVSAKAGEVASVTTDTIASEVLGEARHSG